MTHVVDDAVGIPLISSAAMRWHNQSPRTGVCINRWDWLRLSSCGGAVGAVLAARAASICEGAMRETKRHEISKTTAPGERRSSAADRIAVDFVKLLRGRPPKEVEMLFVRIQSILRETVPGDQARQMLRRYADLYERDVENF
jgi:hypothetical protein